MGWDAGIARRRAEPQNYETTQYHSLSENKIYRRFFQLLPHVKFWHSQKEWMHALNIQIWLKIWNHGGRGKQREARRNAKCWLTNRTPTGKWGKCVKCKLNYRKIDNFPFNSVIILPVSKCCHLLVGDMGYSFDTQIQI